MKIFGIFISLILLYSTGFSQPSSVIANIPFNTRENPVFIEPNDTINGAWNHISSLQMPLFGVTSLYLEDIDKVFICGGADSSGNSKTKCYYYDLLTNSYDSAGSLPMGRHFGKLVRVKDSLYLVGSVGSNFNIPDGIVYKYDLTTDIWQANTTVPAPVVHEMAVCVWNDSLIIAIGGSTNAFGAATNTIRVYSPAANTWRILTNTWNAFPVNITAAQAECIGNNLVVVGGFNTSPYNTVYRGYILSGYIDSLLWGETTVTPFGAGVYRIGSGKFGSYMVFGPGLNSTACINQLWGFNLIDSTWIRFMPNTLDPAANRTSIGIKHTADSLYFCLFGGITLDTLGYHLINSCEKYSTGNPVIGIAGNQEPIPSKFVLYQNYPNPFNPVTKIAFDIPKMGSVSIAVYDVTGARVRIIERGALNAGRHEVEFDGSDLSSGIYFYIVMYNNFTGAGKMVLLK